jgi:hypothetical protein
MGNDHKVAHSLAVSDPSTENISLIDIPFKHRHQCWFCGEPSVNTFTFPHDFPLPKYQLDISPLADAKHIHQHHQGYVVIDCPHPTLKVPSCSECYSLALKIKADDIWLVTKAVKRKLMQRYQKDLAIGVNWTKDELENADFDGGNFAGFKRSAWFIYEVAKGRVNFSAWPLSYHGVTIEQYETSTAFIFDGITYPTIEDAVLHFSKIFSLNILFFKTVLAKVGHNRFAYAVRFCRLQVGATPAEQRLSLQTLL